MNRLEEAEQLAKTCLTARQKLGELKERIETEEIIVGCDECRSWNGLSQRCSCNNRRVCWAWNGEDWVPEIY